MIEAKGKWAAAIVAVAILLGGCSPQVGTEAWCEKMKEKEKGEWTLQETGDYAKHCIIR